MGALSRQIWEVPEGVADLRQKLEDPHQVGLVRPWGAAAATTPSVCPPFTILSSR
jgi:hypothetical protein